MFYRGIFPSYFPTPISNNIIKISEYSGKSQTIPIRRKTLVPFDEIRTIHKRRQKTLGALKDP